MVNTIIPVSEPDNVLLSVALDGLPQTSPIPVEAILSASAFYPASGLDADPVGVLFPAIRSFIYCDYSVSRGQFDRELRTVGFRGYRKVFERDVRTEDIVLEGWSPTLLPSHLDGNLDILKRRQEECGLYGHWSIWKGASDDRRFSFLFLSGEACALFQGLYSRLGISPAVLCLIQAGDALGGNWTNFFEQDGFFHNVVTRKDITPPCLLIGGHHGHGFFKSCCWSGYSLLAKPQPQFMPRSLNFLSLLNGGANATYSDERDKGKSLRIWRSDAV